MVEPPAEAIHVDIMNGHFVPSIAMRAVVVASPRPVADLALPGRLTENAREEVG